MTCFRGTHQETTYWASSLNLIVGHQFDLSTSLSGCGKTNPQVLQWGLLANLIHIEAILRITCSCTADVSIVLSLIKSLEWKDLSTQTNSGMLCRGKQIKEKKNRVNQLFVKGVERKHYHVPLFKRTWIKGVKEFLIALCIVFSMRQKSLLHFFFKAFEDRISELHCSTETRVSQTVKKRKKSAFVSIKLSVFSYQSQYAFSCLYNTAFISLSTFLLLTTWKCLQT